jgi:APA family basic amino acid/polyamine antiporter
MPQATAERPLQTTQEGLVRGIRRWDLVLLVLNAIIGAGIFGLPSRVFAQVGSYSLFAYLVCAVLVVLIILCFAEVSSRFQVTGGPYLYAHAAFGPVFGFVMGWLLWLARLTAFAALGNLWITYLGFFVPGVTAGFGRAVMIVTIVAVFTVLNVRGVRGSTLFNDGITLAKLTPLLLFVLVGLLFVEPTNFSFETAPTASAFSGAVLVLVFAFSGFEMAVMPAGEVSDPRKNSPFALLTGVAFVVVIYLLIQFVSIGTLPTLAESTRPLADAAGTFMGPVGATVITAGALISITGTLNVITMVSPRIPFAMAEKGQLPRFFAATHPRFHTPYNAILISAAVMLVLTLLGSFISSLTVSTVIRLVTYAATCAALPMLRKRGNTEAGFTAPGGVIVTVAAIALCAWLLSSPAARAELRLTAIAAVIGLVLYFVFRGRGSAGPSEAAAR